MRVSINYTITIHQWEIENKFEVKVIKDGCTIRLVIRPLNVTIPAWSYSRNLKELMLTDNEVKNEALYLADLLSENDELVFHIYNFGIRTHMSLGMAFIAWNMEETEQQNYEKKLKETYVTEIRESKI